MDILIVGAGISGLTTARMLATDGHNVTAVEQSPRPRAEGAGLILPVDTVTSLERAGVRLAGLGLPLAGMTITSSRGGKKATVRGRVAFARAELLTALEEAAGAVADLHYGTSARYDTARAAVVADGMSDTFNLVVAADGLRSSLRDPVMGSATAFRYSGQVCWRGIVETDLSISETCATEMWNGIARIGVVPLTRSRTYVYVVKSSPSLESRELGNIPGLEAREQQALTALKALPPQQLLCHEIWELDRPVWGSANVVLLGDAAHGMTPNLGLGAAMAIEDAATLTHSLRHTDSPLSTYRRARHARVRPTQLTSRAVGQLAHDQSWAPTLFRRTIGLTAT